MSSALKSYVEKYLLNPGASFNVDDEGNQETNAQVIDSLLNEERLDIRQQPLSKLRARRAALEADKDPRYKGKKVLRKDLKDNEVNFDPELSKFCIVEGSEDDDEDGDEEEEKESDGESKDKLSRKLKSLGTSEFEEEDNEDDEGSSEENEEVKKLYQDLQRKQEGVTFIDDGDFSKFANDMNEEEDEDEDEVEEEEEEDEGVEEDMDMEDTQQKEGPLRKFRQEDTSEEVKRGQAVKNQLGIHDSLFEGRICMQKVVTACNQLPQHDTYKLFLREQDPNYQKNLMAAKVASKKLLDSLLQIQKLLLWQYPETNHIVTGKAAKDKSTESDEEITSSEEEEEQQEESGAATGAGFQGVKRKMKVEEYEEMLSKRHAAVLPFRDHSINKWYEKTKLLSSRSARGNRFSGFETSALQQLHNILANRPPLLRRTQMSGTSRGATYHVLGRRRDSTKVEDVEYDTEIFDDTDFYTRSLEEVLKAKVSLSDNMTDVSRKWIEIQNLRRKAKKKVDKKASKGRKIRYEVMSKLQQYMAPSHPPQMDDSAINTLFTSLFGKSIQKQMPPKTQ